ncbi:hypothetical protein TKK_0011225 [Trichogramma kaykai]
MAPLSRALSGVILPHDFHGNHLNAQKKTDDEELEKKNFAKAGEILAEIWSDKTIDKFPILAEYVSHDENISSVPKIDWRWHKENVKESQHFLQIVKCSNRNCCAEFRSNINVVLKNQFFPAPLLTERLDDGRLAVVKDLTKATSNSKFLPLLQTLVFDLPVEQSEESIFYTLPYDYHCSSIQGNLCDRVCNFCDFHFSRMKNVKMHRKILHCLKPERRIKIAHEKIIMHRDDEVMFIIKNQDCFDDEWCAIEDVDSITVINESPTSVPGFPVIDSLNDWLRCEWTDDI